MAKQIKLAAQTRSGVGRSAVNKIKAQGSVPAVIYGGKKEPQPLQVGARDIANILAKASGENVLVDLEIDAAGQKASRMALIQEIQHHPLSGKVLHVDFLAVSADQKITANIPVEPFGEAAGVKNFGGILEQMMRSIEVECLPKDLPDVLTVDVSALNIGDTIHVSDIKLPENVVASDLGTMSVFHVLSPTKIEAAEEAATAAAAAAPTAPEVLKQKEDPATAGAADKKGGDKKPEKK